MDHPSSGWKRSVTSSTATGLNKIKKGISKCPDAMVLQGLPIRGGSVKEAEKDIADWLRHLKGT